MIEIPCDRCGREAGPRPRLTRDGAVCESCYDQQPPCTHGQESGLCHLCDKDAKHGTLVGSSSGD